MLTLAQCPQLKSKVIVFGGRGSTTAQMNHCYPEFMSYSNIEGDAYVSCLAQQIDRQPTLPNREKFLIVGHSSGAAQAEKLVHAVKNKSKVKLILLEGFGIPAFHEGVETTCWYAKNGNLQGMNAGYMQNPADCRGTVKAFEAPWCNNPLCLHIALVNLNVPAEINKSNVFTDGLNNCQGNMEWLNP
jgi:hypothetical protein